MTAPMGADKGGEDTHCMAAEALLLRRRYRPREKEVAVSPSLPISPDRSGLQLVFPSSLAPPKSSRVRNAACCLAPSPPDDTPGSVTSRALDTLLSAQERNEPPWRKPRRR